MDNWFKSKWFVSVVALFLAVLLYVFVFYEVRTKSTDDRLIPSPIDFQVLNDIPVNIKIDSERFVVSGVPEEVSVSLEGQKSILARTVLQRSIEVFVDLTELDEGTHVVDLEYDKVPSELTVYIEPKTIEVDIQERATGKFAVSLDFINKDKLPPGYELGETTVTPNVVEILSSRSVIDKIAIVKVYVDVEGIDTSIQNREIPVNIYDSFGNVLNGKISPSSVVVSVEVDNPSKMVSVELKTTGELPEGLTLTAATLAKEEIEVFATSDVLASITSITTETLDLATITASGEHQVSLTIPEAAQAAEETLDVVIELEQTRVIDEIPIEIIRDEDREVSFKEPNRKTYEVTVVGSDEVVQALTEEDFSVSIDIRGLTDGKHTVPVKLEGPADVDIIAEFEEITIIII